MLELLLFYCVPRKDVNAMSHNLINKFGSFTAVLNASLRELMAVEGIGYNAAVLLKMIPEFSRMYYLKSNTEKLALTDPVKTFNYVKNLFIGKQYETAYLLCLNKRMELTKCIKIADGTLDETPLYPRLVVETALNAKAAGVILTHNHPSGDKMPSNADIILTSRISMALDVVGIFLRDHIIIAGDEYSSFLENGML